MKTRKRNDRAEEVERERGREWGREDIAALRLLHIKARLSSPLST